MTLQTSGPIDFGQINVEQGGHQFGQYRRSKRNYV